LHTHLEHPSPGFQPDIIGNFNPEHWILCVWD
jgi:hypothetical protein